MLIAKVRMHDIDLLNLENSEKVQLYQELKKCKNYAINKSYKNFFNIPIERQDLETIAWLAFEEVLIKFSSYKGLKSFESFFIDNVYWKCNDYCDKFTNNRHKILNYANTKYYYQDWNYQVATTEQDWNKKILLKQYYSSLIDEDKRTVFKMVCNNYSVQDMKNNLYYSRTKIYRTINLIANDIKEIV